MFYLKVLVRHSPFLRLRDITKCLSQNNREPKLDSYRVPSVNKHTFLLLEFACILVVYFIS